ncbi:M20/M25/M40 family metallo-hydrolase [Mobilicoccus pelagius]|uniref:Peptidase M20 family protein n=1 Tax=Mobilicoccus pelagius NBRC 104925 TaxID=1089455 RepID=H5UVF3_9MICO|nr:M20/M25/M40 family metallo-hydrolase [Mobilicoccus pelagius]GAB49711.1 peptidase M20 family protein [Mobilicoccus pelagius NBRC 104925]
MDPTQAREYAEKAMPQVIDDLRTLVGHSSIAFPGFPEGPMKAIAEELLGMFRRAGVEGVRLLDLGDDAYPAVFAEIPGPEGSPVVTMYAHYDVQPAAESQGWSTDPWTLTQKEDGRLYGRGAADDKSGVVAHIATLAAFNGKPPVTVRLVVEGEEETGSHIEAYVEEHAEDFRSDVFVVADSGNQRVGAPALTTGLRGDVTVTVKIRTIESAVHSGLFGGAAPDALVAMIQLLGSMYDETGATVIEGLDSYEWPDGEDIDEAGFRESAGVLDGVELTGSGHLASRMWSRPAATVIGIDAPPVAGASNVVIPEATARVSVRIVPGSDPKAQLEAIEKHLRAHAPRGVQMEISDLKLFGAWKAPEGGPVTQLAEQCMSDAFGAECTTHGSGGSIPLVQTFLDTSPGSEAILWGAEDEEKARIHGPDESVDPKEIEDLVVAQILLLSRLGEKKA